MGHSSKRRSLGAPTLRPSLRLQTTGVGGGQHLAQDACRITRTSDCDRSYALKRRVLLPITTLQEGKVPWIVPQRFHVELIHPVGGARDAPPTLSLPVCRRRP